VTSKGWVKKARRASEKSGARFVSNPQITKIQKLDKVDIVDIVDIVDKVNPVHTRQHLAVAITSTMSASSTMYTLSTLCESV